MELYSKVRMAVLRDGLSQREAARRFGIDRETVSKMVGHAAPPGYRQTRSRVRPKLDAHAAFIDEVLKADLSAPRKQRHTIQRLFERLRDGEPASHLQRGGADVIPCDSRRARGGMRQGGQHLDRRCLS